MFAERRTGFLVGGQNFWQVTNHQMPITLDHMTRDEFLRKCEADDAEIEHQMEWKHISRRLDALYAAQAAGDSTVYTRQRIARLEGLQQAFIGFPAALAQ